MYGITDADREAAEALRAALAEISGFWHLPGDAGPICAALARHRIDAEKRLAEKLAPYVETAMLADEARGEGVATAGKPEALPGLGRPDGRWSPFAA